MVVLSFHSLEDRIVKRGFQKALQREKGAKIVTKKAVCGPMKVKLKGTFGPEVLK